MNRKLPKRMTKGEAAYIRALSETSAFDSVDRGRARILPLEGYPEPLKRFLMREKTMVHVKLSLTFKRKLERCSRRTGMSVEEQARRWIEQAIARDAG
jgi:hypothetical protein